MLDELRLFGLYKKINPNELSEQQFSKIKHELNNPNHNTISDEYYDFKLWYMGFPSRQENFANFIAKRLSKHPNAKILEVGGGRTGRLSRFLSEKGFVMTCIDPKLEISSTSSISFIKEKFEHNKFDLTGYDYVVAQEPCDATEHVVRACLNQNKPFMITLCGVPHKLLSGQTPRTVQDWYNYLVNISGPEVKLRYVQMNDPISVTPILRSNSF